MESHEVAIAVQTMAIDTTLDTLGPILDTLLKEAEGFEGGSHSQHFRICVPILAFNAICDQFELDPTEWEDFAERYQKIRSILEANLALTEEAFGGSPSNEFFRARELSRGCFYWGTTPGTAN